MASSTNDPFFEDEEELAREQVPASRSAAPKAKAASAKVSTVAASGQRKPPSFASVVAIAAVALLLGIGIGYFIAMAVVDRNPSGSASSSSATTPATTTSSDDAASMPEGHPDISAMMNPDGTPNQEAIDAFKAQRAAQSASDSEASDGDAADGDAADAADSKQAA